jgi:hypothetical protein
MDALCRVGTRDFDAQTSGIKFWKGDENLRPVYKKSAPKKSFAQKKIFLGQTVFWLHFLGALFTKIKVAFLKEY